MGNRSQYSITGILTIISSAKLNGIKKSSIQSQSSFENEGYDALLFFEEVEHI